eukprot:1257293-Pyramimonas_sp.AAC.1
MKRSALFFIPQLDHPPLPPSRAKAVQGTTLAKSQLATGAVAQAMQRCRGLPVMDPVHGPAGGVRAG